MAKQDKAEELKQKIEEVSNNWKRALADYQNSEKRHEREKAEFVQFANSSLILKLLSVLDNLERTQEHLKDNGLELAIGEFKRVLAEEGLAEIEVLDKEFNPAEMEAVELVEGEEDNKVVETVYKGYRLKDRLVRPAKVKVSKAKNQVNNN